MTRHGLTWHAPVPQHWAPLRLKYLAIERNERAATDDAKLLSVSQYTGITEKGDDQDLRSFTLHDYKRASPGDLVMNIMLAWNGSFAVTHQEGVVSPAYCVFRFSGSQNSKYYDYLFHTPFYLAEFARRSTGIIQSRWRLYPEDFGRITALVPPRPEQDAIVTFLDGKLEKIDRYLRLKEREIDLLEERKRALIHRAVTRGLAPSPNLKPSGIPWLPEIPEGWETWKIGHLARVGNGSTPSRSQASFWTGGTFPWLNSASVNRGLITESDQFVTSTALRECHLPIVPPQSVLVAITGQGKTRGTAALLATEVTINQHIAFITVSRDLLMPEYLYLILRGIYSELRAMSADSGSTKGALTCHDLKHLKIPIPKIHEQVQLVEDCKNAMEEITTTITRARHQIERMQEYRTTLIAEAVTGQRVI